MTTLYTNLLINSGAESGTGGATGYEAEVIPGWTTVGGFTVVQWNAAGFLYPAEAVPIGGGSNFFAGGPASANSSATQVVSLSGLSSQIDAGQIVATLSGYVGGWQPQDDNIVLLDALGGTVGSTLTLATVNAAARASVSGLVYVTGSVVVPVGAVSAQVKMAATFFSGSYNDGYADNISLTLSQVTPPVPYYANLLTNGGGESGSGSASGNDVLAIPGWTTSGNFTVVQYGSTEAPTTTQASAMGTGGQLFAGGPSTTESWATQTVSLTAAASDIAGGSVTATLSAYLGGLLAYTDHMVVTATWLDSLGASLGSFQLPTITPDSRDYGTGLQFVSQTAAVPVGAVSATIKLDAIGSSGYDAAMADNVSFSLNSPSVPCFLRGTRILVERGEVAVEDLAIGDLVRTHAGALRPIKWIGRRSYAGRFILGRKDILPICFAPGSLAEGVPARELRVSPLHAMYLEGVLIPAGALVDGFSVTQTERVDRVEYFHVELDTHDVIIADGAFAETFINDDSRGMFHNAPDYYALYPEENRTPARFCAPRLDEGYEVEAARRGIAERAGRRTEMMEPEPGALRGHVDGLSASQIVGWAQNLEHLEAPVCLDILADGRLIGRVLANRYRADLFDARIGSGYHAFKFVAPERCDLTSTRIEVRRSLDGASLHRRDRAAA
jgi:hypothetical protein